MPTQPLAAERKKQFLMNAASMAIHAHALCQIAQAIVLAEDSGDLKEWIELEAQYRQAESEIAAIEGVAPTMTRMLNSIWATRNLTFEYVTGVSPYRAWDEGVLTEEERVS